MRILTAVATGLLAVVSITDRSSADLVAAGAEFSITTDDAIQGGPTIDHFVDGSVIVVWMKDDPSCCDVDKVMAGRIYDAHGVAAGPEFSLGTTDSSFTVLRVLPPGDRFLHVRHDGVPMAPVWRLYDDTGAPLGAEVVVPVMFDSLAFDVDMDANGNIAILYREGASVVLRRYTMAGVAVGAATVVDTATPPGYVTPFGLRQASDGNLVVAWTHNVANSGNGSPTGWVRRYDASNAPVGSDFAFSGPHDNGTLFGALDTDDVGHIFTSVTFIEGSGGSGQNTYTVTRFALDGTGALEYDLGEQAFLYTLHGMSAASDGRLAVTSSTTSSSSGDYFSPHGWLMQFAADGTFDDAVPMTDRLYGAVRPSSISTNASGSVFVAFTQYPIGGLNPPWIDAKLQRFCDTADADCSLCPMYGEADSDGDLIPDGCDPCTNVAAGQNGIVSKTSVSHGIEPREMRVAFDESFVLPSGTSFADLEVMAHGARLRIESARGQALMDAVLPGGAYAGSGTRGWTASATKLKYTDRTDSPIDGVKRVLVVDQNKKEPGRVRVKARAGGGLYSSYEAYLPMKAIAVLGDANAASAGICGEFPFTAEQCENLAYNANRCIGIAE